MNSAYYVWAAMLALGGVLGLSLNLRTVGVLVATLMALSLVGLVFSESVGAEGATWAFGIALTDIPVLGLIVFIGALFSKFAVWALNRVKDKT